MTTYKLPSHPTSKVSLVEGLPQAVIFVVMSLLAGMVHVVLGASFGLPGFIWLVFVTLMTMMINPAISFALMMSFFFFQNTLISLVSPDVSDLQLYTYLLGTSFLNLGLLGLICIPGWMKARRVLPAASSELMKWILFFLIAVTIYSVIGMLQAPATDVITYIRAYIIGFLFLAIGITFGFHISENYFVNVVRVLAFLLIAWGVCEFLFTETLYSLFNVVTFMHYKFMGSGEQDMIATISDVINFSDRAFLNLSGSFGLRFDLLRPNGPQMHPITYAYCCVFCSLVCYMYRSYFLAFATFCLVVLTGAKGSMIMVIMSFILYFYYSRARKPKMLGTLLAISLGAYALIGLVYGMYTEDYHVIGFLGGIRGFLKNPIGHGIGVGGNLSASHQLATLQDMEFNQNYGADYGFESAFGVMIYQMGVASVLFFCVFWKVWKNAWEAALHFRNDPRLVVIPIALAFLFVNGIFQEEALSPSGWGLWFMLVGMLLIRRWRDALPPAPEPDLRSQRMLWRN